MEFLPLLWFVLITVLWIGYLCLEGFDFGVGMLLRIVGRDNRERRVVLNSIGPHWDGNEVWLITAGGAMFAAFPEWYATMFSGMYLALLAILACLIVRVCAIEWRSKIDEEAWRNRWDWVHSISAWVVSILWGVAFANLVAGMKLEVVQITDPARRIYEAVDPAVVASASPEQSAAFTHQLTGGFLSLLTPFTILGGLVTLSLFLTHGALFLGLKTTGEMRTRSRKLAARLSVGSLVITAAWAIWAQASYSSSAWSLLPLGLAAAGLVATVVAAAREAERTAFLTNVVAIAASVAFIFTVMAPNVMRSSIDERYSLSIEQAAATHSTLVVMTWATVIVLPIVLAYTVYSYRVFRSRISTEDLPEKAGGLRWKIGAGPAK